MRLVIWSSTILQCWIPCNSNRRLKPMKQSNRIFNIGFNKCGTTTLSKVLDMLGFNTVHFKHKGVRLYDIIQSNIRSGRELLCGLKHYNAFSDFAGQGSPD